jgi:dTDP-4-dehydrorhamnose 3,5-epimerase-like enzyme
MAYLISLKTFSDNRGNLTVIEDKELPFKIKRVFYIYGVDNSVRGGHRHKSTIQALVALQGSCDIYNNDNNLEQRFTLNHPSQCLILEPQDWHNMYNFSKDCILQVFASEYFSESDYIWEAYP